jgi:alkanesulfonate monooxygenase SsuD/methylene tetrahydromethanopterin reductase-like flavin-dependent oxidoreductase (luciferase family)
MEYWSNPINPATARDKFRESLKIILQAWKEDGPTPHYGQHYTYRFLNPWPRPYQQPHPPCYIVGTGSPETIEIAAELGFGYASVFVTQQRARLPADVPAPAVPRCGRKPVQIARIFEVPGASDLARNRPEAAPESCFCRGCFAGGGGVI